jgi:tetratricopeptide (TPR) repeat protein
MQQHCKHSTYYDDTAGIRDKSPVAVRLSFMQHHGVTMRASRLATILGFSMTALAAIPCAAQAPAQQPDAGLQQVEILVHQGRLDEARALTLDALQQHPSADGFNLLGVIESQQHDDAAALAAFRNALQLAPRSVAAHNNLGNVYLAEKKFNLAEKEFRTVLQIAPQDQAANYNLAVLLMTRGSAVEAIPYLERIHPATTQTRFELIRALLQTHRINEALRAANQLSAESPNDVQLHSSLGILLASQQQYAAAQLELEKANTLNPGTFEILFNLGQVYLRNGDNKDADLALSRAVSMKPDASDALFLLAQVHVKEQRPLDALDLLVRANKLSPTNPEILYLMSQISMSQGYYEDAIPTLTKAIQTDPNRIELKESLAECLFHAGQMEKAIEALTTLTQSDPSARTYSFLGLAHAHLGRFDQATQDFQHALRLDPHNVFCLFQLGYIARQKGDTTAAAAIFTRILQSNPEYPYALLELANIEIERSHFSEAERLLTTYVRVSNTPATGYYKLAMVQERLHNHVAAQHALAQFQSFSKNSTPSDHPYDNLFVYIDSRSKLTPEARQQQDLAALTEQLKVHPGQREVLYALTEEYLKEGKLDEAKATAAELTKNYPDDSRSLTDTGVLLARYGLYNEAIQHFLQAEQVSPGSDDISYDLADAYFRGGSYREALDAAMRLSNKGQEDDAVLALLGDIYAHLGDGERAEDLFQRAIKQNPENDQDYLSLAMLYLRQNNLLSAKRILQQGQVSVPGSGKIIWGLGLIAAMEGETAQAENQLERAVDILPEWPGAYSTLGVFYYETGQIAKAREVLDRFKGSGARGGLDVNRIEETLAQAPVSTSTGDEPLSAAKRTQLLQIALFLADKTM